MLTALCQATVFQTNPILAWFEQNSGKALIALILGLGAAAVMLFIMLLQAGTRRKRLAHAESFLAAGDLATAATLLRSEVQMSLDPKTFERALSGLEQAYARAGITINLATLRQLRRALGSLDVDPKFSLRDGGLNSDGVRVRNRMLCEAIDILNGLPAISPSVDPSSPPPTARSTST